MDFKMMFAVVMRLLGITAFNKDTSGKMVLEEAQEKKLKDTFGEDFTKLFAQGLSEHTESNAVKNAPAATDAGGLAEQMMAALNKHNEQTFNAKLEDALDKIGKLETKNQTLEGLVNALSGESETLPEAKNPTEFAGKDGVKVVMKVDKKQAHYAAYNAFRQSGTASVYAGTTIDVSELKSEFGTFLNTDRNIEILAQLFQDFTSAKYFKTVLAVTEYRASQALITSVVQQFTSEWTPSGKTKFTPIIIKNRRHKINVPIKPAEVLDSYIFHLYDEQLSPDQMPITKYITNTLVSPQILQDLELRMIFKGKYVEVDDVEENDAATPPEDAMDGLETILVEAKSTGDKGVNFFTPSFAFNLATATDQQILKFVQEFVDWIKPLYRGFQMNIHCSHEFWKRYRRAYKNVWGQNSGQAGDFGSDKIDFSNNTLVPLDGMYGSPIIFATPAQNMVKLRHKNEVPKIINDVQKANYTVKLFGEFWFAVGFPVGEAVFAYVPDGYNPKAAITATYGEFNKFPGEEIIDDGSDASGA